MKPYTVLLLRPPCQREGHPSDWIYRAHVNADDPDEAMEGALDQLADPPGAIAPADPDEAHVLAIYEGHLFDLFQP